MSDITLTDGRTITFDTEHDALLALAHLEPIFYRGHPTALNDDLQPCYRDTGELCWENNRPCPHCGREWRTIGESEPDPCLGELPGVKHACCGHGGDGYVMFENGTTVRFRGGCTVKLHRTFEPMPDDNGGSDFDLVFIADGKPSCLEHGAMNKVSPSPPDGGGYWRCITASGPKRNPCRAGCRETTPGIVRERA